MDCFENLISLIDIIEDNNECSVTIDRIDFDLYNKKSKI